jgi:hypothetical protein
MTNFSAYGTRRISLSVPVMLDKDVETISSRLRSSLKEISVCSILPHRA